MKARVAIGIPAYGQCPFLGETIESVVGQSMSGWSLVVCDDGNGDAAEVVAPYLADERISYISNESRLGAAGNWSKVVQEARAELVAVLSQDDFWGSDYLERRLAFLDRHPECGFVYGPHVDVDEHGLEIKRAPGALAEGVHQPVQFVPRLLRDRTIRPSPPSILVRRAAYECVGPRFDERFVVFDLEMWLRIALQYPVGYVAAWDSYYRMHPAQLSKRVAWGLPWLEFDKHAEQLVAAHLPDAQLTSREQAARRRSAYLSAAMDMLARGSRREVLGLLGRALQEQRRALVDVRLVLTLLLVPFGRAGGRALGRLRWWAAHRGARLPFHARH